MNRTYLLQQHSALLVKASLLLRRISTCLREGNYEEAMELETQYRNELQPLVQGMSKRNSN